MRSWSILVGRLFGVEVRLHLTFFLLPLFIFWTEYGAQRSANGGRDLALVGIILACVGAHEVGHILASRREGMIPKAVILLPLSGVTLFEEPRKDKDKDKDKSKAVAPWKREIKLALVGPLVNLALAVVSA
jgi:stage IV sporulation protein FB